MGMHLGQLSISISCPAMLDFPELEVPFRKMICPRRPWLPMKSSCQARYLHGSGVAVRPVSLRTCAP